MTENIIFDFAISKTKNQLDIFDFIKLCKLGETCLDANGVMPNQLQNSYKISYIVSGTGHIEVDKKRNPCSPGDLHILPRGVGHIIKSDPSSKLRYIYFSFDFTDKAPKELYDFYNNVNSVIVKDKLRIGTMLNMLIDEFYYENSMTSEMCECIMKMIIISIYRNTIDNKKDINHVLISEERKKSIVYNVIKYIEENFETIGNVKEISDHFSYASNYMSHLMKKYTGMSLKEHVIATKMNKAKDLILDGKSVQEVAAICGYDSVTSFSRLFKKYMNITVNEVKK